MPPTNSPLLMGIDAGTSRVRALLFELDGTLVAEASDEPSNVLGLVGSQPRQKIFLNPV